MKNMPSCHFPVRFLKINTARRVEAIKILEEPTRAASIDGRVTSCKAAETTVACSQPGHKMSHGSEPRMTGPFFSLQVYQDISAKVTH